MIRNLSELLVIKICLLGLLTGCATTPSAEIDENAGADLTDSTMDVMFATEFPVESEDDALARAADAIKENQIDRALFFYVRALQFRPDNVELLAHIGEIQLQRKNYSMANQAFLTAKSHDPTHGHTREGLGLIYMAKGLPDLAVAEFTAAIASDSQLWRSQNALGVNEDKNGNYATAQRHYDAALLSNPDAAHVLNNRGYSKYLSGDASGAMDDLYEAAKRHDFAPAWANLGRIYAMQGSYKDAIKTYKNVMSEAHAMNNAGHAAIENGDLEKAEFYILKAIRLSPTYFPSAEENLASLQQGL